MVILIVVEIWFCTKVGACVLQAEMLVRKRKEARNTSQSVVIVIQLYQEPEILQSHTCIWDICTEINQRHLIMDAKLDAKEEYSNVIGQSSINRF